MSYPNYARTALGDDTASQDELTRMQNELHDLAVSIAAAHATGQTQAEAGLRAQFNAVKGIVDQQVADLHASEAPSGLAMFFANAADTVRGLGGKVALVAGLGLAAVFLLPMLTARRAR